MAKFFLPDLLPHHDGVILYDTDVLIGRPLSELWAEFANFAADQVVGVSLYDVGALDPNWAYQSSQGVCSCMSLQDLDKMRRIGWAMGSDWLRCLFFNRRIAGAAGHSDQALNTWVWAQQPSITKVIGTTWINSGCQDFFGLRNPRPLVGQPVNTSMVYQSWGALHSNCWDPRAQHTVEYAPVAAVWHHASAQVGMERHFRACHAVNRTLHGP
jgi:hypothetical protein